MKTSIRALSPIALLALCACGNSQPIPAGQPAPVTPLSQPQIGLQTDPKLHQTLLEKYEEAVFSCTYEADDETTIVSWDLLKDFTPGRTLELRRDAANRTFRAEVQIHSIAIQDYLHWSQGKLHQLRETPVLQVSYRYHERTTTPFLQERASHGQRPMVENAGVRFFPRLRCLFTTKLKAQE